MFGVLLNAATLSLGALHLSSPQLITRSTLAFYFSYLSIHIQDYPNGTDDTDFVNACCFGICLSGTNSERQPEVVMSTTVT